MPRGKLSENVEMYLETSYVLTESGAVARTRDIAHEWNVSQPSATEMVQKLALQNDATVYLLYVVPGSSLPTDLEQVARDNLRGIAQKWLADKIAHEIVVSPGNPATGRGRQPLQARQLCKH